MKLGYEVRLEQRQQLSQNQIQSLEILAMDVMELGQFLQNEYLENPLLDCTGKHDMVSGSEEINKRYEHVITYGKTFEEIVEEDDKRRKDIPVRDQDLLKNYLLYQLPRKQFSDIEWELLGYMIDCLDDTGYFTTPIEEIAKKTGNSKELAERMLKILENLEPHGIFAADLKHCLLKQLEVQGKKDSLVWQVVEEHLQDVADGKISNISRQMKISTAEVRKCIEQIAKLNPRPMNEFAEESVNYIVPDIIFQKEHGKWEVELNDDWVEDYHINDYYLRMMKESKDEELMEYFRGKLERIRFVMNSILQRRQTMIAISEEIIRRQERYLEGEDFLRPMTMTEVADAIGIHPSTVSRAIKGKYVQYPRGVILMKLLFSASAVKGDGDNAVSTMQIKQMIREMIEGENKKKPFSDQALVNALKEKKIDISRRAVAKYREELGIKGSFDRKE